MCQTGCTYNGKSNKKEIDILCQNERNFKWESWIYKDIHNQTFPNLEEKKYPSQIRHSIFIETDSLQGLRTRKLFAI